LFDKPKFIRYLDELKGWIALFLIGLICGCIASFFYWNAALLVDFKEGIYSI
jgi:hypothetical protein